MHQCILIFIHHPRSNINAIIRVPSSMERAWMPPLNFRSGGGTRRLIRRGEPMGLVPSGFGGEGRLQARTEFVTLFTGLSLD